jgi:hypothetical protein
MVKGLGLRVSGGAAGSMVVVWHPYDRIIVMAIVMVMAMVMVMDLARKW